jgi:hypothetical protein
MNKRADSKCGKPAGSYCSIHNPAPKQVHSSNSAGSNPFPKSSSQNQSAVISSTAAPQNSSAPTTSLGQQLAAQKPNMNPNSQFLASGQTRKLGLNVPHKLIDHIKENQKRADEDYSNEERYALMHYPVGKVGYTVADVFNGRNQDRPYVIGQPSWQETKDPLEGFATPEDFVSYVEALDAVGKRSKTKRIVYSGVPEKSVEAFIEKKLGRATDPNDSTAWPKDIAAAYTKGEIITFNSYFSTSQSPHFAAEWGMHDSNRTSTRLHSRVVYEMLTDAGADITGLSDDGATFASEREVLLPREVHFKIVNVDIHPAVYDAEAGIESNSGYPAPQTKHKFTDIAAVVQMVEVDKNGNVIKTKSSHQPSIPAKSLVRAMTPEEEKSHRKHQRKQKMDSFLNRLKKLADFFN